MEENKTENLKKVDSKRKPETSQGFVFCPRCGNTVVGENITGFCGNCGYRFCPSCSD